MGRVTVWVFAATVVSLPLAAQVIELTPIVGYYAPLRDQMFRVHWTASSTGMSVDSVRVELEPAVVVGAKAALRVNRWAGLEVAFASTTATRKRDEGGISCCPAAPVPPITGTARMRMLSIRIAALKQVTNVIDASLGIGPALVLLGGPGYHQETPRDQSMLGLTVGGALGFSLSSWARLEVGVTDHAYRLDFGEPGPPPDVLESRLQHDLVTSLGFRMALRR